MKAVIGLFDREEEIDSSIAVLKQAGFAEEQIKTFKCSNPVCKLLSNYCQCHMVQNWAIFGALFGLVHAAGLAFFISFLANRLFTVSPVVWILIFVGLTAFGAFLGTVFGFVFGEDQWVAEKKLFRHGAQIGERVVAVEIDNDEMAAKARLWLQDTGAIGIETLAHLPGNAFESIFSELKDVSPPAPAH